MREIEFRAKSEKTNSWEYGLIGITKYGNLIINNSKQHFVNENTISQFTGLSDKNGKKIYEGDIIKSHYGSIYIVKYFADWSGFSLKLVFLNTEGKLSHSTGRQHLYKNDCTHLEVVGNIYDNPELLEEL